jgi:COP9 signalosome complex subunit 1
LTSFYQVLIEQRNYAHIGSYVYKAESALEMSSTGGSGSARRAASAADQASNEAYKERVQSKLDLATALSNVAAGHYEKAARGFLKIKSIKSLENWAKVSYIIFRVLE